MACPFYFMRPDEIASYSTGVSVTAGGTDTDYSADWAADQRPGRPWRSNAATMSLTLGFPSADVGMVVLANHNYQGPATFNIYSTSFSANTETPPDGIPLNPFFLRTPSASTGFTIASTTNHPSVPVVGEVIAGKYRTLSRGMRIADAEFSQEQFAHDPQSEFSSISPYDKALAQRTLTGSIVVDATEFTVVRDWFRSQRGWTKPSVIVPDGSVNDAWVVTFRDFRYRKLDDSLHEVRLTFVEYPRSRW